MKIDIKKIKEKLLQKESLILIGIVLTALVLRFIHFFQLKNNYPFFSMPPRGTDMLTYHEDAIAHLEGTFDKFPYYFNMFYAYFVALIYKLFGRELLNVKIFQIFLGSANCVLIYHLTKRFFNKTTGLIAAALTATYGLFIVYEGTLLIVTILSCLLISIMLALLKAKEKPSYKNFIIVGILMGLVCLARASNLLFLPAIFIWMLLVFKQPLKKTIQQFAIIVITTFLLISPVTIKNYEASGKFILITENGGINFAIGNCPGAKGWFHYPAWLKATPERRAHDYTQSGFWVKETLNSIKKQPKRWLRLMRKKFYLFWWHKELFGNIKYSHIQDKSILFKKPVLLQTSWLIILGLIGMLISIKQWRKLLIIYLIILTYMFGVIIIVIATRYRIPFVQIIIPFAAFTIHQVYLKIRDRDFKFIGFVSLMLLPCITLTYVYDIYENMDKIKYIKKHPYGTYYLDGNILYIRDYSGIQRANRYAVLDTAQKKIRKTFVIDRDVSKIKKATLILNFIGLKNEGVIVFEINGRIVGKIPAKQMFTKGRRAKADIPVNPGLLMRGENEFVFSAVNNAVIKILIDNFYTYNRSAFSTDSGLTWNTKDLSIDKPGNNTGEYMMTLKLEF